MSSAPLALDHEAISSPDNLGPAPGRDEAYITGAAVGRLLGRDYKAAKKLAELGLLTVRRLPGMRDRYLLKDALALAQQSVIPKAAS